MRSYLTCWPAAVIMALLVPATAQDIPRMPDGKPNFTGLWQYIGTANWDLLDHSSAPGHYWQMGAIGVVPPGQGVVVGNEIPYLPEALDQKQRNFDNRQSEDPEAKCYMPGVPRANYMPYPFQIIQGNTKLVIAYQFASANRNIEIAHPAEAVVDTWMGWSNGHWEGDTLVVEVTGQNGQSWFDRAGDYASANLKVTERYSFLTPNHIQYEATMEDPSIFSRPWTIRLPLYRRMEENAHLIEFKCVEYVEKLLYQDVIKDFDPSN